MEPDYDPRLTIEGHASPAVVLVPGMNGSGQLFYRQVPRLSAAHRVATYWLRDDAGSLDVLADDLRSIVERLAPSERVIVIGESFGGAVALTFALTCPEQVDALVILNSFPHFTPQFRLTLARVGLAILPWGAMKLVRRLTAWRLHSHHTHRVEMKRFLELTAGATKRGYLNRLGLLRHYDVRERLRALKVPVLFLAATEDHLVPSVAQARDMAARAPHSTLGLLDGHGHICLIAPDLDLAAIIDRWQADLLCRQA